MRDTPAAAAAAPSERSPLLQRLAGQTDVQETDLAPQGSARAAPARQLAPDLLRGFLMVAMASDHIAVILGAYPHGTAVASEAASTVVTQWSDTEPFLLRTLTHLCAPGFAMLMGMGLAYWSASRNARGTPPREQVSHLLKRGLALLLVNQVTFLLLSVRPPYFIVFNAVLWALAIDYVCVGGMTIAIEHWLQPTLGLRFARPPPEPLPSEASKAKADGERHASMFVDAVLLLLSAVSLWANVWTSDNQGACTAAEAHTTAGWPASAEWCRLDAPRFWYKLAFGVVQCVNIHVMSAFPPIGWLSFVLFGLLYGRVLVRARWARHTVGVFNASLAVIFGGLFAATRLLQFGNLSTDCLRTPDQLGLPAGANQYLASWRSFLYVTKYPPSPAYAFLTLSACFLLLALFSLPVPALFSAALLPFGQTPLFYYAAHQIVIQLLAFVIIPSPLAHQLPPWAREGRGIGLGAVYYCTYAGLMVLMWFACSAYGRWKSSKGADSIWRFL
ncbi:hypothetical protein FA09DRAFT_337232 [Tilletiopsis washingtonensis]|uniref:Heparan-alpha-glucosaminide N-acetyltransferase catalytic domain-containing protein n=1 Tax=Tilletiopsis washingtonensis TaxID=58919 RepID=A0A316ZHI1_9BASI|nr:hypothetical protein FA09DRAFT_337232 [Tilletiopsis washingtonensis]PWN99733.1 hypothetical protein FA09DRAFT_337232 [Tilletiopsis washingtonensis]